MEELLILVYKEFLKTDLQCLKSNMEHIAYFSWLARKYLDNKSIHDKCLEIIDLLEKEQRELAKDIENDQHRLGYQKSGDAIRFRME